MALHRNLTTSDGIHIVHAYEYADATARLAATGFTATDVGKVAYQVDDASFWILTGYGPITWVSITAAGALASTAPLNVTKAAAAVGTGTTAARADHKHDVTTATAGASAPGDTTAEGTATSLARSDHRHSLPAYGTTAGTFCQGNDARLSDNRTDANAIHKNVAAEISTITAKALPVRNDLFIIEDSEASNAKKRATLGSLLVAEPDYFSGPVRFYDEFFPPALDDQWTTSTSGTGSLVDVQLAPGGQVLIRAGNANGRTAELLFGGGVAWQSIINYDPDIRARMKYDGTNNGHIEFEVHYADSNNYVFLEADWGGNWLLSCRSGGTLSQVDTGVALDNAWHTFAMRSSSTAVTARIDDVLVATITTNIPTDAGTVSIYVAATGTGGTKNLLVDGFFYTSNRPS